MACAYASRKTLTLCRLIEGCCANRLPVPRPCTQQLANDSSNMKTNEDLKRNDLVTLPLCNSFNSSLSFKVESSRLAVSRPPFSFGIADWGCDSSSRVERRREMLRP